MLDYNQRFVERNGGLKSTQKWARTFMVPSLYHCGDGTGLTEFDATKELVDWVESGDAPDRIDAVARAADGTVTRTRPVFPYPLRAKYDGSGSVDDPANFYAVKPAKPVRDKIRWLGEYLHYVPGPVAKP
jgi:feruloyl esterase